MAVPALLKAAFYQFAADTHPMPLGNVLQVVQYLPRPRFLFRVGYPYLRQALVGRQLAGHAREKLPLHTGGDTFHAQSIGP